MFVLCAASLFIKLISGMCYECLLNTSLILRFSILRRRFAKMFVIHKIFRIKMELVCVFVVPGKKIPHTACISHSIILSHLLVQVLE